jgi:polo-like kinase 1
MHKRGAAHLDLKLENILIGEKYEILITDFDTSYIKGDPEIIGRGTTNYRAPEILNEKREIDPFKADIFSLGIILFTMALGNLPYIENGLIDGIDLQEMVMIQDPNFWIIHGEVS